MRRLSHLTPRYVRDRLALKRFERRHPDAPWLTQQAVGMLADLLRPGDVGMEWGSGRSTTWIAPRIRRLVSVESSPEWHRRVTELLAARGLSNVEYELVEATEDDPAHEDARRRYAQAVRRIDDGGLDFALVDGRVRDRCLLEALPKMRPGGVLVLDNANWYLPGPGHAPDSIPSGAPAKTPLYQRFWEAVADWRMARTINGVSDTWFWFVPPDWTPDRAPPRADD